MNSSTQSSQLWNQLISQLPNPHFLQTYECGQVKAKYGWIPYYAVWTDDGKFTVSQTTDRLSLITDHCLAAALILKRQILSQGFAARLSVLYAPKGPLLDWNNEPLRTRVLNDFQSFARKQGAIFLKLDPDVVLARGVPHSEEDVTENSGQAIMSDLKRRGWVYSSDQIQFKNSVLVDLTASEDEILMRMKPKTRYNVRLAEKKGVTVRVGTVEDLPTLYKMYAETSVRDGFVIRNEDYYMTVWKLFMQNLQPSTFNLQPPTFNRQPSTCNSKLASCSPWLPSHHVPMVCAEFEHLRDINGAWRKPHSLARKLRPDLYLSPRTT